MEMSCLLLNDFQLENSFPQSNVIDLNRCFGMALKQRSMTFLTSDTFRPSGFRVMMTLERRSTNVITTLLWWTPTIVSPSYVTEFFLEGRIIRLPICDISLECLFSPAFLMAIRFSFSLHGKGGFIEGLFLELAIKGSHGTTDCFLVATDDDVRCPALGKIFFDVGLLILR